MEKKDIAEGKIGEVGSYDVEFVDGKLVGVAKLSYENAGVKLSNSSEVSIDSDIILDAIAKKIPGTLDDALIELVKKGLKAPASKAPSA